ncbi:MAG: leucine-rich repeat domain-containing protein, partial [Candidatus Sifarchaeia archaeon]
MLGTLNTNWLQWMSGKRGIGLMTGLVKVPRPLMESWHRNLSRISKKHPEEVPLRVLEVREEIQTCVQNSDTVLADVQISKLESWSDKLTIYVGLASEHYLLPLALCDSMSKTAQQIAQWSKPHVRYVTKQSPFMMQEIGEHYYGGLELTLSQGDAIEVDLSPLGSCTDLKRVWLAVGWVTELDISPLGSCTSLETLYISSSNLRQIDLGPLSSCKNLRSLDIIGNRLDELDLSPLSACINLTSLNLSNSNLSDLDLTPLSECKKLRYLSLDFNSLDALDLSPLSSCESLSSISLENNSLSELDLFPLSRCANLSYVDVGGNALTQLDTSSLAQNANLRKLKAEGNRIQEIDLAPLSGLKLLTNLNLGDNQIEAIDLSPLSKASRLEEVSLHSNKLTELSVDSLIGCKQISSLNLEKNHISSLDISRLLCTGSKSLTVLVEPDVVVEADSMLEHAGPKLQWGKNSEMRIQWRPILAIFKEYGWDEVKKRFKAYLRRLTGYRRFAAKRGFLQELGMPEISGVDKDITPVMESIEDDLSFAKVKNRLYYGIVQLLREQLIEGGSSFFLDIDRLKETRGKTLTARIRQGRKKELESTIVPEKNGFVHLEPLWLTVHGFEVLKNLRMPVKKTTVEKFQPVKEMLREKGLTVKIKRFKTKRLSKKHSVMMSSELKQYI